MRELFLTLAVVIAVYIFRIVRSLINKDKEEFLRATVLTAVALPVFGFCYLMLKNSLS